jgi:hypothetical protein
MGNSSGGFNAIAHIGMNLSHAPLFSSSPILNQKRHITVAVSALAFDDILPYCESIERSFTKVPIQNIVPQSNSSQWMWEPQISQ